MKDDEIENSPDIFFHCFSEGKRFAFQRMSCKEFVGLRKFCCLKLLPDPTGDKVRSNYKGGVLKFSMRIYGPSELTKKGILIKFYLF